MDFLNIIEVINEFVTMNPRTLRLKSFQVSEKKVEVFI